MFKSLFTSNLTRCLIASSRTYSSLVDKNTLSKLRKRTGISFINCKKALEQFNNDIEQAEKWLLQQAQKEGWAKATKLQGRAMSQGLVGLISNNNSATLVEVNCETDFVAKNNKFQEIVEKIAVAAHEHFKQGDKNDLTSAELGLINNGQEKVADLVALTVGNLGENMAARRATHIKKSPTGHLATYMHASGSPLCIGDCKLGKFGAFVEVEHDQSTEIDGSLTDIAVNICRHIVGMNPKCIGKMVEEKTQTEPEEQVTQSKAEEDKEEKSGDESTEASDEEDMPVDDSLLKDHSDELLNQEFLLNSDIKVGQYITDNGITVKHFSRFQCGEMLEGDADS